ncbi:MAG: NUDIX domain-containing protein [Bacteroidales bacterium]|nr:NUDIX domain-containing protein [Bacteroidales bacterium]
MSPREYCHSGSKVLHPVVHLHILSRSGELYLQKRSLKKKIQPGKWDTAVGGHVMYGESLTEALMRESSEELGFTEYNPVHLCTYIYESEIEKELVTVFVAVGRDFVLTPDHDELDDGRFWSLAEIDAHYGDGTLTPNFESEFSEIRKSLLSLL